MIKLSQAMFAVGNLPQRSEASFGPLPKWGAGGAGQGGGNNRGGLNSVEEGGNSRKSLQSQTYQVSQYGAHVSLLGRPGLPVRMTFFPSFTLHENS